MAALLGSQGYTVLKLLDSGATKATVIECLEKLVAKIGFGGRLVWHNSSHGTWMPDRSGDEFDGRDEAICCYDYAHGGLLTDDEIEALFAKLRYGARALVLSDSCHSGSINKFLNRLTPDEVAWGKAKFLDPVDLFDDVTRTRAIELEERSTGTPRLTASLISGCMDGEYSYDASFGGVPNGAFTRAALDTFVPGITLSRWHRAILDVIEHPQTPQLSASAYRRYTRAL